MKKKTGFKQLVFLLFAIVIGVFGFLQVELNYNNGISSAFFPVVIGVIFVFLLSHTIITIKCPYADPLIFPTAALLNFLGLIMIYRLALRYKKVYPLFGGIGTKQLMWVFLSLFFLCAVLIIIKDHRVFRKYSYTALFFGVILLILPLAPIVGSSEQGAQIWIKFHGISFQPAEFSKIFLGIFFAGYLVKNKDVLALAGPKFFNIHIPRLKDFGPILVAWLISLGLLIFEHDLGTSILFFGLFVAMLYIATNRVSWIFAGGILLSVGIFATYFMFGHVRARFDAWLNPFSDVLYNKPFGGSSQLVKGLFGLANGGMLGTGLGLGRPDITDLAFSDYIYTSLGEELGLVGLMVILLLLLILVSRGLKAAVDIKDSFGKLLVSGLSFAIIIQVFVVIGGVTRLIPVTGMTLPFLASGGSSLVANWVIVGLMLKISNVARRPIESYKQE